MKFKIIIKIIFILILNQGCSLFDNTREIAQHDRLQKLNQLTKDEDQSWNELGLLLKKSPHPVLTTLKENVFDLYNGILLDSSDPHLPIFWGMSLNFDSGAKEKIVDEKIIRELEEPFGIIPDPVGVHAGVMHTYAYLFSTLNTPYGYKRKRWIDPSLNLGFNFTKKSLSPFPLAGAFLSNVTYFFGMFAFKDHAELKLIKNVSNEVFTFPYESTPFQKISEELKDHIIVTSLVELGRNKNQTLNEYSYLLIYSYFDKQLNKEFLITGFPITKKAYLDLVLPNNFGKDRPIVIRYNGYIKGLSGNLRGHRKLSQLP